MIDAVIGQDQGNRRKGTRPNQGLEPPLLWSVEFMKEVVHVESNETAPLVFLTLVALPVDCVSRHRERSLSADAR